MSKAISPPRHGGALVDAAERFGAPDDGWLDLSTGINPIPYQFVQPSLAALHRLPDPADLAALLTAARATYGVPDSVSIAAVPGSDSAIRLLPLVAPAGDVAIVEPTYSAHREAWRSTGRKITAIPSWTGAEQDGSIVVLANPNNPDGRITPAGKLLDLAATLTTRGGLLVVDEAFAELAPECSIVAGIGDRRVVVFRSFGKFYGLPGLRLGFVIGTTEFIEPLRRLYGDWPLSGPAIAAARQGFADVGWQVATRQRLRADRQRLDMILAHRGMPAIGGTDLFALAAHPHAIWLHEHLARAGIWTRIFADEPGWIRIGMPRADQFLRLDGALASFAAAGSS